VLGETSNGGVFEISELSRVHDICTCCIRGVFLCVFMGNKIVQYWGMGICGK
jgi:hypothetical protein